MQSLLDSVNHLSVLASGGASCLGLRRRVVAVALARACLVWKRVFDCWYELLELVLGGRR